jgi:hypothetical protein
MTGRARLAFLAALAGVVPSRRRPPMRRHARPAAAARCAEVAARTRCRHRYGGRHGERPRASLRPLARGGAGCAILPRCAARGRLGRRRRYRAGADVPPPATTRPAALTASGPGEQSPCALRPARGLSQSARASATRQTPGRVTQPGTPGTLCGIPGLSGDRLEPITGRISGCGIAEPVRLRLSTAFPLTTPATINCDTARALQTWVREGLVPAVGRTGGGVANLRVVASYACRTRNSQAGARLSEHAVGNAIDIAGIGLANGEELTVLDDWNSGREGRILREAHSSACGTFGTVLGPNSDRFHRDHFHFDVASYRSGAYCR